MTKTVALLGSTGSIGTQTLEVMAHLGLSAASLSAHRNTLLMEEQVRRFLPTVAAMADEAAARDLKTRLADTNTRVLSGPEGLCEAAAVEADCVCAAVAGTQGLLPTLTAVRLGRRVALSNKETLVCAGELITREAKASGAMIVPVDSEHSAIFQCLRAGAPHEVSRLILTASGGPFFGKTRAELASVTARDALKHPNWSMGAKVTIDSATLLNKGLERMEAMWLFGLPPEDIEVVVHRQSVIHSMVEFRDGSVIAQLGLPDMRLPIQYALTWPERLPAQVKAPDWSALSALTFAPPDAETFGCLTLAYEAAQAGGTAPTILSAAGEQAVALFLRDKIGFLEIEARVREALEALPSREATLENILEADREARDYVNRT